MATNANEVGSLSTGVIHVDLGKTTIWKTKQAMVVASEISFSSRRIEDLTMPHQVRVNPLTGAADINVPIPLTPGRSGFAPSLSLQYSSAAGNSVYGVGWSLVGLPVIGISTKDGLPKYNGEDRFAFNGDELVPTLQRQDLAWEPWVEDRDGFWIHYFRSKVERSHIQFEQWVHKETGRVHWRTRGRDNTVSIYGLQADNYSRIADPNDQNHTYLWLIEAQYDNQGNAIFYEYLPEDAENVNIRLSYERDRLIASPRFAQRYLKRIRYGNTQPLRVNEPIPADNDWLFEVVFDYGEHRDEPLPSTISNQPWSSRLDAYSNYRPGFEVRTYRLCRRILMFHHFSELGVEPMLVGSTELEHREDTAGSTLQTIRYTGFRRDLETSVSSERSLPLLKFEYSSPNVGQSFHPIPDETRENFPQGLSSLGYRWIDLYGEGIPGILTETSQAWYYKPNYGDGVFGAQTTVIEKPSLLPGTYTLSDFDQDGNLNLVVLQGRQAGFYEFDRDNDEWKNFQPFASAPQIDFIGAKVQWLDLNGDGRADILISEQDRFIWYPSDGKEGFREPIELAKPQVAGMGQPPQLAENPNLDFFFADINGDGLLDLVRVQNGRVEYWPQIGNGRFGDGILMEDAPILDFDSQFDASRLRFTDLDGSGTADLLYIGRGEVRYWINASGNRFIEGGRLTALPYIDNLASVQILDFLGDGTPCLVWSSALPGYAYAPLQYLQLTNGIKPRLLLSIDNSMGQETQLTYSLSSRHYLRDKRQGQEWLSKLPSHMTVVERKDVIDRIGRVNFVSRYEYHDGYFDSEERTFRGFGLVDQYNSEVLTGTAPVPENYTAPACIRTWYHNGAFGWDTRRFTQYYQSDRQQGLLPQDRVENLAQLGANEFEDGIRSLAGMMIRQEVYATDGTGQRAEHPYQVTQNAYRLRRLQPSKDDNDACFMAYQSEQLSYSYEQQPADPRIGHQFTLEVDDYGNVLATCAIAYPRRSIIPETLPSQQQIYITASRQAYLNIEQADRRELGIPIEGQVFEVSGLRPADADSIFQFESLRDSLQLTLDSPLMFHESFEATGASVQARLISWNRNYYWNDEQTGVLPLKRVGQQTLLHHSQSACFTDELIVETLGDRVNSTLLETEGYYTFDAGYWWQRGETYHYLTRNAFYLPNRIERLDAGSTTYTYDAPYFLTLVEVQDAVGNRTQAEIDYHLIAPHRIVDANDNVAEVRYDPLGMVVVSTTQGTILGEDGTAEFYGSDRLSAYAPQTDATFDAILAEPERFLQTANQFFYYELDTCGVSGSPLRSLSLTREELVYDGQGNPRPDSRIQITVSYMDGFGRSLQSKQLVEEGLAIARDASGAVVVDVQGYPQAVEVVAPNRRWLVSGHVVYNNKQQPVRQYEPFFSTTAAFESDEELRRYGVSARSFYDPVGRQIRMELPNGSLTRVTFTPWEVRNFDPNDTVLESPRFQVELETLPEESWTRRALSRSLAHANTPTIVRLDALGREVMQIETSNSDPNRIAESRLDIQGNVREVIDARGLTAFTYRYDMLGRVLYQRSIDSGEIWSFQDALNQPTHRWDGVGVHQQTVFDRLGRPVQVEISGTKGDRITERMVYGDDPPIAQARERNLRGQLVSHYDQAGVQTVHQYTPDGTPLGSERQLLEDYRTEPDWRDIDAVVLDPALRFETRGRFDALSRVREQRLPDGTTRQMDYLLSGGIAQVRVSTADGMLREVPFLEETEVNARGQRVRAVLGNDIELTYEYDREMFRMSGMTAVQPASVTGENRRVYQDIAYTYDPVGNLIHHVDQAQQPAAPSPTIFQGLNVSSHCDFTYDAFYQLKQATGRVHQALMPHDYRPGLPEPALKNTQHLTLNNGAVVERYTRTYDYDLAGNIRRIDHRADSREWVREMWISPSSNRSLPARDHNDMPIPDPELRFDANGNCLYMPHLRAVEWNYRNNISRVVIVDRSAEGGSSDVEYYVYGSDGMRLRKVQEKLIRAGDGTTPELVEVTEKIYLNGAEIKRVLRNGEPILERTTSHISDGTNRIALLHQWSRDQFGTETGNVSQKRIHYQLSNHLGSASLEVDAVGNVISYEEYFPFGGAAFIAGNNRRDVSLKDYRYSGKERDEATGFYYYGYRYYVPWTGRWLSPDPIGPKDGLNLYQFVRNNPVVFTDIVGLTTGLGRPILPEVVERRGDPEVSSSRFTEIAPNPIPIEETPQGGAELPAPRPPRRRPTLMDLMNPPGDDARIQIVPRDAPESEEPLPPDVIQLSEEPPSARAEGLCLEEECVDSTDDVQPESSSSSASGDGEPEEGEEVNASDMATTPDEGRESTTVIEDSLGETGSEPVEQSSLTPGSALGSVLNNVDTGVVGPEDVNAEALVIADPNAVEQVTSEGSNSQEWEDLSWEQFASTLLEIALVVLTVIIAAIVAIAVAYAVGALLLGLATISVSAELAVAGVGAVALAPETLTAIGVASGLAGGLAGNATSQGLSIAFGNQQEFDEGQFLFDGAVGAATGGLGSYFSAMRAATSATSTSALRAGATRFGAGALEGGGTEALRQTIFEDEFNPTQIAVSAAIGGGANVGVGAASDYLSRSSHFALSGSTSTRSDRPNYRLNSDGVVRTDKEATNLLVRSGVFDPDDEFRLTFENQVRSSETDQLVDAAYEPVRRIPLPLEARISWDAYLSTARGGEERQVAIRVSREILNSDERLIGTVAHELYELNRLRDFLLDSPSNGTRSVGEVREEINRLHKEAVQQEQFAYALVSLFRFLLR